MKKILPSLLILFLAAALSSCSMEKRTYRNGWYIDRSSSSSEIRDKKSGQAASCNFTDEKKSAVNIQHDSSSTVAPASAQNQQINVRGEIKSIFQSEHQCKKLLLC